jgi:uncharacterized repeat protein (TIGR04002 family)
VRTSETQKSQALRIKTLATSAVFVALIFISIYVLAIPNGLGGVIHFGDSLIWIAAAVLPLRYAAFVSALGPGLFNLARVPVFLPFTVVIKPITALCFTNKSSTILCRRNIIAPFFAGIINTALYFLANMMLFAGNHASALSAGLAALPGLLIQAGGSLVFYFVTAFALDRLEFKQRIFK